jgi:hypothetical protein
MEDPVVGLQEERLVAAATHLVDMGWAVVPGVVSAADCARLRDELHAVFTALASAPAPAPAGAPASAPEPLPRMKGIIMEPSALSHAAPVWELRKRAAPYLARLHGDACLVTSMDRVNHMPPRPAEAAPARVGQWLHTDQTPLLNGLHSVQAFVDLCGTGARDGGLVVADRSHRAHHDLLYRQWGVTSADNWFKFTNEQAAYIRAQYNVHKVECPPGSMCIWDSRTFHQNEPVLPGGHERLVVYVCAQPLSVVPPAKLDAVLARRVKAYEERRASSHVPLTHFKLFSKYGRTYGRPRRVYGALPAEPPHLEDDPVLASLVGASRAPCVRWPEGVTQRAPLLTEPLLPADVMVMNQPQLLRRLGGNSA